MNTESMFFWVQKKKPEAHLLKSLVVDKAGSILGDLELALLYLLAEFPVQKETSGAIRDIIQMTWGPRIMEQWKNPCDRKHTLQTHSEPEVPPLALMFGSIAPVRYPGKTGACPKLIFGFRPQMSAIIETWVILQGKVRVGQGPRRRMQCFPGRGYDTARDKIWGYLLMACDTGGI